VPDLFANLFIISKQTHTHTQDVGLRIKRCHNEVAKIWKCTTK